MAKFQVTLHTYELTVGFHAGVEVHGVEYAFSNDGIYKSISPGMWKDFTSESVSCGITTKDAAQVKELVETMHQSWPKGQYSLASNNCCHFARRFLLELGANDMPPWVDHWTNVSIPLAQTGISAGISRTAARAACVGAAETAGARLVSSVAGPAGWASFVGDCVGSFIGTKIGSAVGNGKGADAGRNVGGFTGSVGSGAIVGGCVGGPGGAAIGAGIGLGSFAVSKVVGACVSAATSANAFRASEQSISSCENFLEKNGSLPDTTASL